MKYCSPTKMASPLHAGGPTSLSGDVTEAPPPPSANDRRRGGWITTPFITGSLSSPLLHHSLSHSHTHSS